MKILIVSSEVVPFAKTGGLADVAGALPIALSHEGHDVRVVMPLYSCVDTAKYNLLPIMGDIVVRVGGKNYVAQIRKTLFPDTNVPVYFVDNPKFFDREALYGVGSEDYPDNAIRFAFFCKAVVWLLKGLDWIPDVIQCNDWQTALLPVYLSTQPDMRNDAALAKTRVLFTIHNLAYQGLFPASEASKVDVGPDLFHPAGLEFYGKLNLMKGGILFSDEISTVSKRYAQEIQTPEYGAGLDGVLTSVRDHLVGILNGIDYSIWNPETDKLIPHCYSPDNIKGKAACKAELQKEAGLKQDPDVPLIGIISRLDKQKGFDLITDSFDTIMATGAQVVLLGTGAQEYHKLFSKLAKAHPKQFAVQLKFDNGLAHRIEAGSDIFLMPSRYEPCGLNQLYSLKYGTIPVVRKTGGLADSITDATPEKIASGEGTGFVFEKYTSRNMLQALQRALKVFANKPEWHKLMHNAMTKDYSWDASARQYEQLMEQMAAR